MRVKAKWNVKGSDGWHETGEIFETEEDYGDAVEVLEAKAEKQAPAPKTEEKPKQDPEKPVKPEKETEKPKTATRRRKTSE